jgi:hypothetical protein
MTKSELGTLVFMGLLVNSAVDGGMGSDLDFDVVYEGIEQGTLLDELDKRYPGAFDFSLFRSGNNAEDYLIDALRGATGGIENRERRKVGVENNGLCLIVALLLEALQTM